MQQHGGVRESGFLGTTGGCFAAALATLALGVGAPALAQDCGWTHAADGPFEPRHSHALAYDRARGQTVLFGGNIEGGVSRETWTYDGDRWTLAAEDGPLANSYATLAFDQDAGVGILFGGVRDNNDTWAWDGERWQFLTGEGPSPRWGHDMVFDSRRGVYVLFGGNWQGEQFDQTWEFNGREWLLVHEGGPSPRRYHRMAYDQARGVTVLFGGDAPGDTVWEWDGRTWRGVTPSFGPQRRWGHAMAYDPARGAVVIFGGRDATDLFADTWQWDGNRWTRTWEQGPAARYWTRMAYDTRRGKLVLVGGSTPEGTRFADTWETACPPPCYPDFDRDGALTIFDFLAFQNAFDAGDHAADCDGDGALTLFDFLCFQNGFDAGCG